ncbi:tetratricopeptide repeat protein [Candidatus Poribacteria bacterium]|nr:tetratricopeptide repeat protein [Candidatus Poribacteria bacterium]
MWLGDLQKAEEYNREALEVSERIGSRDGIATAYWRLGVISLSQGRWERSVDAYQKLNELHRQHGEMAAWGLCPLGWVYLSQGNRHEAARYFQENVGFVIDYYKGRLKEVSDLFGRSLSGLEPASEDPEEFRAFCRRLREAHPEVGDLPFVQWYLEPAETQEFTQNPVHDAFAEKLSSDWVWHDEFNDCSFTVGNGLEIHAANGRDLWHVNLSAPRILRAVSGDFAVQVVCTSPAPPHPVPLPQRGEGEKVSKPAIGGILLWRDKQNYLRLDKGTHGTYEINFSGCIENKDLIIGRGRLPSERVFLRLERIGGRVNALCSADGEAWFTVGSVDFPVGDLMEVGLHAIGNIDRTLYHGAFPEGTATAFQGFELWTP